MAPFRKIQTLQTVNEIRLLVLQECKIYVLPVVLEADGLLRRWFLAIQK